MSPQEYSLRIGMLIVDGIGIGLWIGLVAGFVLGHYFTKGRTPDG